MSEVIKQGIQIGVDIDDVLYKSSLMLKEQGTAYLNKHMIPYTYNKRGYLIKDIFGISETDALALYNACEWEELDYIDQSAVRELCSLQSKFNAQIYVVTRRNAQSTDKITFLMHEYFNFDVQGTECLAVDKRAVVNDLGCDIMLDDYEENISNLMGLDCKPILVSPSYVYHNEIYARDFPNVLYSWNDLQECIAKAMA